MLPADNADIVNEFGRNDEMPRTIVAMYDTLDAAQRTVLDLVNTGFDRRNISLVANDAAGDYGKHLAAGGSEDHVSPAEGTAFGAAAGALTGVLVSLGALAIPGIGPVIAAGPLVAGLTGAVTGALAGGATGGIIGALLSQGVEEEDAQYYAEGIRRGGTLVVARADDEWISRVEEIMNRYSPIDVERRADQWRITGWQRFDHADKPYSSEDLARERQSYRESESDTPTQPIHTKRIRMYDESEDRPARV
jgi:hypothetical protein